MVARAHIAVGKHTLDKILAEHNVIIYKPVYLFGCIAPDINFVYPCHNIICTPKRFQKRIGRMLKYKSPLIRSFTLGVILHYICDYFCIAHNNNNYGARHTFYERLMSHYLKCDELNTEEVVSNLDKYWNNVISEYKASDELYIKKYKEYTDKCREVFDAIKGMNEQYRCMIDNLENSVWYNDRTQMQSDLDWAMFISEKIYDMIYSPIKSNAVYV